MNVSPTAVHLNPFTPARLLRSGYVRIYVDEKDAWLFAEAGDDISDWVPLLDDIRRQQLLNRLATCFDLIHMSAADWDANLDTTDQPATVLRLWETIADTFDYFTLGKKLSAAARKDYFRILLAFFNHSRYPDGCFNGLQPGRAERIVKELDQYFNRTAATATTVATSVWFSVTPGEGGGGVGRRGRSAAQGAHTAAATPP